MEEIEVKRMETANEMACIILDEVEFKTPSDEIKAIEAVAGYVLNTKIDPFIELENDRMTWSLKTFPEATVLSSLLKAEDEIREVKEDIYNEISRTEEYVDVLMCVLDSAGRAGISVEEIIHGFKEKLIKNKARKWIKNPDNTYSHQKTLEKKIPFEGGWSLGKRLSEMTIGMDELKGYAIRKMQLQKGPEKVEWEGVQMQELMLKTADSFIITYE